MQIVEMPVNDLIPYANNPRHNEDAVKFVAESIKAFGFRVPIIVDSGNVIVAGHTRLLAAKELGLEKVPCIRADDMTEEQVQAFRLADNKVSEMSSWDWDKLETELSNLTLDMTQFGFESLDKAMRKMGQQLNAGGEIDTGAYANDKFSCTCPKCGFKFNPKG